MKRPLPPSLSLVIPAFNEERRLGETLRQAETYLAEHFPTHEILIADDGSTDGTARIVEAAARANPAIRWLGTPRNEGKGAAVRRGMLAAQHEIAAFTDADLSTPLEELPPAIEQLRDGYAIVIGSRAHPHARLEIRQNPIREGMGKSFNRVVQLITRLPFPDTQCGFKVFTHAAARQIFPRTRIDGFAFDVEVLVIARELGLRVVDLPVHWRHAPHSRVNVFRHPLAMLLEVGCIHWHRARGRYR